MTQPTKNDQGAAQSTPELCPFCGATPHRGPTKVQHDQLHGEPFQRFALWCPHGCARIERVSEADAVAAWNTRALTTTPEPTDPAGVSGMADQAPARLMLLDLLAVVHRDGGHKTQELGVKMAWEQAMQLSSARIAASDTLQAIDRVFSRVPDDAPAPDLNDAIELMGDLARAALQTINERGKAK